MKFCPYIHYIQTTDRSRLHQVAKDYQEIKKYQKTCINNDFTNNNSL